MARFFRIGISTEVVGLIASSVLEFLLTGLLLEKVGGDIIKGQAGFLEELETI
jgi:hypothetical protein